MGMINKADCLQKGELVKFQVCTVTQTGQKMACNVVPQRRAVVECVKDQVVISYSSSVFISAYCITCIRNISVEVSIMTAQVMLV